jgi:hypothetical protein
LLYEKFHKCCELSNFYSVLRYRAFGLIWTAVGILIWAIRYYSEMVKGTWSVINGCTVAPHQHCPMLKWSRPSKQISVSLLFLVVMVAGDFMHLLSTGATFIWRVAEGTRRCHSHPCCVLHAVPDCEKCVVVFLITRFSLWM